MTAVDGMDEEIVGLITNWRKAREAIVQWSMDHFHLGDVVYVEAPSFKGGFGIVAARDERCSPDKLPVRLGNGNVWWYPLDGCILATHSNLWPRWIQEEKKVPGA